MPASIRFMVVTIAALAVTSPRVWGQEVTLAPSVEIGVSDGDERYVFGNVAQVAVGPDQRLYVLDNLARRIQVFDAKGRWLRTVGRRGVGPGEFEAPWRMAVTSEGLVVVRDLELERYSLFEGGEYLGALPAPNDRTYWDFMRSDAHGRFYDGRRIWADSVSPHFVLRFTPTEGGDAEVDTLELPRSVRDMVTLPGGAGFVDQPFGAGFYWAVGPDGAVWTAEGRQDVVTHWRGGTRVGSITGSGERPAIPPALRDSVIAAAEAAVRARTEARGGNVRDALREIRRPTSFNPIQGLAVDQRGRVWIERPAPSAACDARFEVVDPAGTSRRQVCLKAPEGRALEGDGVAFGRDFMWIPTTDAFGVDRLVRYELSF